MTTEIGIAPTSPSPTRKHKMVARGLLVAAMAGGLAFAVAMPAAAGTTTVPEGGSGDTTVTFALTGGALTLDISDANSTWTGPFGTEVHAAIAEGFLGDVSVADARGEISSWSVTATSAKFVGSRALGDNPATVSTSAAITYDSGTVDFDGDSNATTAGVQTLDPTNAVAVAGAALVTGGNTATWNPTLKVTMTDGSLADTYSAKVTTSID